MQKNNDYIKALIFIAFIMFLTFSLRTVFNEGGTLSRNVLLAGDIINMIKFIFVIFVIGGIFVFVGSKKL